jgi:hypothetical protein
LFHRLLLLPLAGCAIGGGGGELLMTATPLAGSPGECRRPASSTLCDRISNGLTATASNPQGRWSLGWQGSPDATLETFDAFAQAKPGDAIVSWKKGADARPCASLNPTCNPITNGDMRIDAGEVVLRPGTTGQYSTVRWTPRQSGAVIIHAAFSGTSVRDGRPATVADVRVRRGATELSAGKINAAGNGNTYVYDARVPMGVGDTLDFLVGGSGPTDLSHDGVGVDIEVCAELLR